MGVADPVQTDHFAVRLPLGSVQWRRSAQRLDLGRPLWHCHRVNSGRAVTFAGAAGGYGLRAVVDHGAGVWSAYSHLQAIAVRGSMVDQSGLLG